MIVETQRKISSSLRRAQCSKYVYVYMERAGTHEGYLFRGGLRLRSGITVCLESVAELTVESVPRGTQLIRYEAHGVRAERLAEDGEREPGRLMTPRQRTGSCDGCTRTARRCKLHLITNEV